MGKRIAIGLLAVLVIGAGAFWYSSYLRRRENSIEYHKQGFETVRADGQEGFFRRTYGSLESAGIVPRTTPDFVKRERHRDALVRLGYLQRRVCVVSNYSASKIVSVMSRITAGLLNTGGVWEVQHSQTNSVTITAPPADLDRLEAAIHKADGAKELK
jgi:hypothetical protein